MKNHFVTLTILLLGLINYSFIKSNSEQTLIECNTIDIGCLQIGGEISGELVITTDQDYQNLLLKRSPHSDCGNYELPQIDFNKYVLIGYIKGFKGCKEPITNHTVSEINGEFEFKVEIEELGVCKMLNWVTIWCVVEKNKPSPTVNFHVNITNNMNY